MADNMKFELIIQGNADAIRLQLPSIVVNRLREINPMAFKKNPNYFLLKTFVIALESYLEVNHAINSLKSEDVANE